MRNTIMSLHGLPIHRPLPLAPSLAVPQVWGGAKGDVIGVAVPGWLWGWASVLDTKRGRGGLRVAPEGPPPGDASHDVELVGALRGGKPGAAGLLWDRYSTTVRRIVQRALGQSEAEDIVQEIFLRLFERVPRMREPAALRSFVFTVTSSVIASEIRKRRVRRFLGLTREGALPDIAAAPRDDDSREVLGRIYGVLERAHEQERLAFVLRHVEGLELLEVAAAMGVSEATVKRRLRRVGARINRAVARDAELARAVGIAQRQHEGDA